MQTLAAKKAEPNDAQQLADENASLREENRCLKNTLKQYCGGGDGENIDPAASNNSGFYGDASSLDLHRELEVRTRADCYS